DVKAAPASAPATASATSGRTGTRRLRRAGSRSANAAATTSQVRACARVSSGALNALIALQRVEAATQAGVDGAARQVEQLGDLAGCVLEQIAQDDHGALVGRELGEHA